MDSKIPASTLDMGCYEPGDVYNLQPTLKDHTDMDSGGGAGYDGRESDWFKFSMKKKLKTIPCPAAEAHPRPKKEKKCIFCFRKWPSVGNL